MEGKACFIFLSQSMVVQLMCVRVNGSWIQDRASVFFLAIGEGLRVRLWCPTTQKIVTSGHVTFDKKAVLEAKPSSLNDVERTNSEYQTQSRSS